MTVLVFIFISQGKKCKKKIKQDTWQKKKNTERITHIIFECNLSSINAYLLVPTVSDGEHPLIVDEHPTTEVVTIVEGGHEWTRVRTTLPPANDPSIFTGNCRCHTQKETHLC